MASDNIHFSVHGLVKLTVRSIDAEDVIDVIRNVCVFFNTQKINHIQVA